jgi:tryptophan halogenase
MKVKKVAIVGGGTGGLITALLLKTAHPYIDVDLIESKSIGIVGVGEGSTEHWAKFMRNCDISLHELISETDATFKYGINFANWNGDGRSYIQSVNGEMNMAGPHGIKFVYANLISKNVDPLFLTKPYVVKSELPENNYNINQFHFHTFKLNDFLHKKCFKKGIRLIEAELDQVLLDEDGSVKSLRSNDGRIFEYDFYVDSTGFSRFIMNKAMGIKWISYSKYLPMNSAIAFPTERIEDIPAWTLARAMKAGWLWRIPTQERFGNGYVFNDSFLDFDQAVSEVEELYGHKIEVAKKIKFDAGCLEKSWHKNCAAIGLSSSFIEPLEASSIGTSIQQAMVLCETLPYYVPSNDRAETVFNKHSDEILQNILDFVALHYITKRNDTEFWKSVKDIPRPPGLEKMLEIYKNKFPSDLDFDNKRVLFQAANWILVMHGLGIIDPNIARQEIDKLPELTKNNIEIHMPPDFYSGGKTWVSHRRAINNILGI